MARSSRRVTPRRPAARRTSSAPRSRSFGVPPAPPNPPDGDGSASQGEFTGRFLVVLREDGIKEGLQTLKRVSGLASVCRTDDFRAGAVNMAEAREAEVFVLDQLKVAVVDADPSQMMGLQAAASEDSAILAIEPERIMYAIDDDAAAPGNLSLEYLKGYRDGVAQLYESLAGGPDPAAAAALFGQVADSAQFSWGLQATKVDVSRFSGKGVRVAVLDTGFSLAHPDFAGRPVQSQSFVSGQAVDDRNGHGTHCIGTVFGPQRPPAGMRRYGCAFQADVFAGKVLSNEGSGSDSGILAGINWAITNKCRIISMSLGAPVQPNDAFSPVYETVAQRALNSNPGTIIIAAAGNDSRGPNGRRLEPPRPVGRPANCPSILAVAAVDSSLSIAAFSNGGINQRGGGVDIAGPGVNVFSTAPVPAAGQWPPRYHSISGTSMATPHVAGIAAMWLQARGLNTSAPALWQLLTGNARRLRLLSRDVGAGLAQAPV
jgi:subtilisin family serine protease